MRQAQINVRTRACSRTSIARTKQAALTHNVRGKELNTDIHTDVEAIEDVKRRYRLRYRCLGWKDKTKRTRFYVTIEMNENHPPLEN